MEVLDPHSVFSDTTLAWGGAWGRVFHSSWARVGPWDSPWVLLRGGGGAIRFSMVFG